jgi:hypothetical protein
MWRHWVGIDLVELTSFFFCSSFSIRACAAFFCRFSSRSSSNRAFFSSSVKGLISSVDSENWSWPLIHIMLDMERNYLAHEHTSCSREILPVPCYGTSSHTRRTSETWPLPHPLRQQARYSGRSLGLGQMLRGFPPSACPDYPPAIVKLVVLRPVSEDALRDEPDEHTATLLGSNLCTLFRKPHLNEQIKIGSRHPVCSFWWSSGGVW